MQYYNYPHGGKNGRANPEKARAHENSGGEDGGMERWNPEGGKEKVWLHCEQPDL